MTRKIAGFLLGIICTVGLNAWAADVSTWSTTAASNNSAAPDGAPENMAPSGVNDVIRQNMAEVAEWYMDNECSLASAVGTDSYAITTNVGYAALSDISGLCFEADVANTGAATLNVDSLGAKAIVKRHDVALETGDIEINQRVMVVYNADTDTFEMVSQVASSTSSFSADVLPTVDDTYDLGSAALSWQDLFIDGNATMGNAATDTVTVAGDLTVTDASTVNGNTALGNDAAVDTVTITADTTTASGGSLTVQGTFTSLGITDNADANALTISANEEITMPLQPAFLAYNSAQDANQTGSTGSGVTVDFDTEVLDKGGDFAADTFTAPVTGAYYLEAAVELTGITAAADDVEIRIETSNRAYANITADVNDIDANFSATISVLADMDAADTAFVTVEVNGEASNVVDFEGNATRTETRFSGYLAN